MPAEPRPALTHALPNAFAHALTAAADERCPVTKRLHAAHQSADTHGQLHLPAAGPQPAVRTNKPFRHYHTNIDNQTVIFRLQLGARYTGVVQKCLCMLYDKVADGPFKEKAVRVGF